MLKLDHVTFRHESTSLTYDFSLEASPKEIIAITGESGSGKTTLLELIAGFLIPDGGNMTWQGENLKLLPPEQRPITTLFQNHNLFEHLTAGRNIALGIRGHVASSTIEKALKKVGLAGLENQRASNMSGGQQQRVALARTFMRDTPILLLDEPFTGLDGSNKAEILSLIKTLAEKETRCVLMITHNQSDCDAIATKQFKVENSKLVSV
ncbi:MAG: ATP-binding cassette domain-containing protein [Rhizobiaceae bacterium]|nr:ATP-binding cassette domain-containing protein [Rhizobiaceae bacterium]